MKLTCYMCLIFYVLNIFYSLLPYCLSVLVCLSALWEVVANKDYYMAPLLFLAVGRPQPCFCITSWSAKNFCILTKIQEVKKKSNKSTQRGFYSQYHAKYERHFEQSVVDINEWNE